MSYRLPVPPLRRARLVLSALIAVAFFLLTADHASAQWLCSCPADFKNTTNCIETKLQRINDNCYYLIVYNHQSSTVQSRCNSYDVTDRLTMRMLNPDCWRDNGISMTITAIDNNPTYPTGTPVWFEYDPVCPTCYTRSVLYDSVGYNFWLFEWRRTPNFGNPQTQNPMRRCEVDTFMLCLDCEWDMTPSCLGKLQFEVYFGQYPNGMCVDEIGLGKTKEIITVEPPSCREDECGACPKYLTTCNSYSITYGCDYADVAIVNDHGYPECTMVDEFEIIVGGGAAGLLGMCSKETDSKAELPQFRNWKVAFDPTKDKLTYKAPPGCGLAPCDTFKVRIPFCCESNTYASIQIGKGACLEYIGEEIVANPNPPPATDTIEVYIPGSTDSTSVGEGIRLPQAPGCNTCYYDKDKAAFREFVPPPVCDTCPPPPTNECDTIWLFNRNHSPAATCGSDGTGNRCWDKIEVRIENSNPACIPQRLTDNVLPPIGGPIWTFKAGNPICGCDSVGIIICCGNPGTVTWKAYDAGGSVVSSDSVNADWGDTCLPGAPKPNVPRSTPDLAASAGHALGLPTPNPTTGRLTIPLSVGNITSDTRAIVRVYDATGRVVAEIGKNVHAGSRTDVELDGSAWSNGMYYVEVEIERAFLSTPFTLRK